MPTMDLSTVGRTRDDEQATIEELSGAQQVGGTDRRWLLALAGIAAFVCLGFVSSAVAPPSTQNLEPAVEPRVMPTDSRPATSSRLPIEVLQPVAGASVNGGRVAVSLRATPHSRVHVSVAVGDAILGWRDVVTDGDGSWAGAVRVFASRVALPAAVTAVARFGQQPIEARTPVVLVGGSLVIVWDAGVNEAADGRALVRFAGSAPLTFTDVTAQVTADGRIVGRSRGSSYVDAVRPGSAGAKELGLGTISGSILINEPLHGRLVLHLAWRDASTGATSAIQQDLDPPADDASPPG